MASIPPYLFRKQKLAELLEHAQSNDGSAPPIADGGDLNATVTNDQCTRVFEPVFDSANRFQGWEEIGLRWMKPDGKGGLVPRDDATS